MKLKEIKPGMVIHCKTEDEAKELFKHLDSLGYKWNCTRCDNSLNEKSTLFEIHIILALNHTVIQFTALIGFSATYALVGKNIAVRKHYIVLFGILPYHVELAVRRQLRLHIR